MLTTGSGTWRRKHSKQLCEDLFRLDVNLLAEDGVLFPGCRTRIEWPNSSLFAGNFRASTAVIGASINGERFLRISFCWDDREYVTQEILLTVTRPHFGGARIWFRCPGTDSEKPHGLRCAKLYCHERKFACRKCHDLRYKSQREGLALQRALRRNGFGDFTRADIREFARTRRASSCSAEN